LNPTQKFSYDFVELLKKYCPYITLESKEIRDSCAIFIIKPDPSLSIATLYSFLEDIPKAELQNLETENMAALWYRYNEQFTISWDIWIMENYPDLPEITQTITIEDKKNGNSILCESYGTFCREFKKYCPS